MMKIPLSNLTQMIASADAHTLWAAISNANPYAYQAAICANGARNQDPFRVRATVSTRNVTRNAVKKWLLMPRESHLPRYLFEYP